MTETDDRMEVKSGRNLTIAKLHVEGMNCREIAKEVGLSKSRVSQILRTEKIREVVDSSYRLAAVHLLPITKGILKDCYSKEFNVRHNSRRLYLKFLRLTNATEAPSTLNQIYVDQRGAPASPEQRECSQAFARWYLTQYGDTGSDASSDGNGY